MYARVGRPSIAPEKLLRAHLQQLSPQQLLRRNRRTTDAGVHGANSLPRDSELCKSSPNYTHPSAGVGGTGLSRFQNRTAQVKCRYPGALIATTMSAIEVLQELRYRP